MFGCIGRNQPGALVVLLLVCCVAWLIALANQAVFLLCRAAPLAVSCAYPLPADTDISVTDIANVGINTLAGVVFCYSVDWPVLREIHRKGKRGMGGGGDNAVTHTPAVLVPAFQTLLKSTMIGGGGGGGGEQGGGDGNRVDAVSRGGGGGGRDGDGEYHQSQSTIQATIKSFREMVDAGR